MKSRDSWLLVLAALGGLGILLVEHPNQPKFWWGWLVPFGICGAVGLALRYLQWAPSPRDVLGLKPGHKLQQLQNLTLLYSTVFVLLAAALWALLRGVVISL